MDDREHPFEGHELSNFDPRTFDMEIVELYGECKDCDIYETGDCKLPVESIRRLVPKNGGLIHLDTENGTDGKRLYFALLEGESVRFILLRLPENRWASAAYVREDEVPGHRMDELR